MAVDIVTTEGVIVNKRKRRLDKKRVKALAESMGTIGLQYPISVRQRKTKSDGVSTKKGR